MLLVIIKNFGPEEKITSGLIIVNEIKSKNKHIENT